MTSRCNFNEYANQAATGAPTFPYGLINAAITNVGSTGSNQTLTSASSATQLITPTANIDVTLPSTSVLAGQEFTIINQAAASTGFLLTIKSSNGNTVRVVYPQGSAGRVMATQATPTTSAHWEAFGTVTSPWIPFTPTGSWSTNTTYTGMYKRVGDTLTIQSKVVTSGAPTAADLSINIPFSLTIDTAKVVNTDTTGGITNATFGPVTITDTNNATYQGFASYTSTTAIRMNAGNASSTYLITHNPVNSSGAVPFTFGSGDICTANFSVPISGWTETKG